MRTFLFLYIFYTRTCARAHTQTHTHTQGCAAGILTDDLHIKLKAETFLLAYSIEEK